MILFRSPERVTSRTLVESKTLSIVPHNNFLEILIVTCSNEFQ